MFELGKRHENEVTANALYRVKFCHLYRPSHPSTLQDLPEYQLVAKNANIPAELMAELVYEEIDLFN